MSKSTFRIVMRGTDGQLQNKDYHSAECIAKMHTQVGIDDCSTDLSLRGLPVFRGLIGPMPEDKGVVGMNEGKPVFRVKRSKALRLAKMLALPVAMLGMLAGRMNTGIEIDMGKVGMAAAGLGLLGLIVGRFLRQTIAADDENVARVEFDDFSVQVEFGLRAYQEPAGSDMRGLSGRIPDLPMRDEASA